MSAWALLEITGRWSMSHSFLFSIVKRSDRISRKWSSTLRAIFWSFARSAAAILLMSLPAPPTESNFSWKNSPCSTSVPSWMSLVKNMPLAESLP